MNKITLLIFSIILGIFIGLWFVFNNDNNSSKKNQLNKNTKATVRQNSNSKISEKNNKKELTKNPDFAKFPDKNKFQEKEETIFAVNITKSIKGEINDYLELNGDIKTTAEVDVYPEVMGKLTTILVSIGQYVSKDDIIAYVDPSRPGMTFEQSPVKATINGTITAIPAQIGSTVTQQTPIVKIGNLSNVKIVTFIAEKFISKIKIGLDVIITLDAYPDLQFRGYVAELAPIIDPQSRMMEVKILLYQRDSRIKPGMFSKLKIITDKKNNIVKIPEEALVNRYGEYFVFAIDYKYPNDLSEDIFNKEIISKTEDKEQIDFIKSLYNIENSIYKLKKDISKEKLENFKKILGSIGYFRVKKLKVISGIRIDNKVEIVKGLEPDEDIVIRGQTLLDDKTKVKIIDIIQPLPVKDNLM